MKEFWLRKEECTGCSACKNICPANAIEMTEDNTGFQYPDITQECINCDACQKVCEKRITRNNNNDRIPKTYAVWSKDETLRFTSTSGGAFTILAEYIIKNNGIVCGAKYNNSLLVEHGLAWTMDQLEELKQSKYVQSNIGNIYKDIKGYLNQGKKVAFVGAPCQVAGLYAYLGKVPENLYTMDFICRGVNSPKAYQSWLREIEKNTGKKAIKVWFKYKVNGWKKSPRCTRVDYCDGTYDVFEQENNLYMAGYLGSNLYIRPSCGDCQFKGVPRQGDVTLADFWKVDKTMDDDKGTSMVLLNNIKGNTWFEAVKDSFVIHERTFEEILEGNGCFSDSVIVPKEAAAFLKSLDKWPFSKSLKKYEKILYIKKIPKRIRHKVSKVIGGIWGENHK